LTCSSCVLLYCKQFTNSAPGYDPYQYMFTFEGRENTYKSSKPSPAPRREVICTKGDPRLRTSKCLDSRVSAAHARGSGKLSGILRFKKSQTILFPFSHGSKGHFVLSFLRRILVLKRLGRQAPETNTNLNLPPGIAGSLTWVGRRRLAPESHIESKLEDGSRKKFDDQGTARFNNERQLEMWTTQSTLCLWVPIRY
jgi:hypothetical protein